jgi:hypothetical protein
MKRNIKNLLFAIAYLAIGGGIVTLTGCDNKPDSIAGRTYEVQCIWSHLPTDFSPEADFNDGGALVFRQDSGTVIWTLNDAPKNTSFRGTYDKNGIAGNITDDLGHTGIFQGARR